MLTGSGSESQQVEAPDGLWALGGDVWQTCDSRGNKECPSRVPPQALQAGTGVPDAARGRHWHPHGCRPLPAAPASLA